MKAADIEIVITKQAGSDNLYEGYLFYKKIALQSVKGEKITLEGTESKKPSTFINLFMEGKPVEIEDYINSKGEKGQRPKPDIQLWATVFQSGSVQVRGDFVSDFGLFYQVEGYFSPERESFTVRERTYDKKNEYDNKAQFNFIEKYAEIITDIPEVEYSEEDLALSVELFPDAIDFYERYASIKKVTVKDLVNPNAPRLMPGAAKKKAPVTQGQLDLAKDNLTKAKAKTAVETEELPF
jgi:hypothetical protein